MNRSYVRRGSAASQEKCKQQHKEVSPFHSVYLPSGTALRFLPKSPEQYR